MSTRYCTNDKSNTLLRKVEGIFEDYSDLARSDALIGYRCAKFLLATLPVSTHVFS